MTCTKTSFADEAAAQFYIKKLQKTSVRLTKPHRAYLCDICMCWHLSSKPDGFDEQLRLKDMQLEKYREKIKNQTVMIKQLNDKLFDFRKRFM